MHSCSHMSHSYTFMHVAHLLMHSHLAYSYSMRHTQTCISLYAHGVHQIRIATTSRKCCHRTRLQFTSNSNQPEQQLGQGGAGKVIRYESARNGPVARKMLTSGHMYMEEVRYLRLCATRSFEELSKFIIKCIGHCTKSDHMWLIDFELAKTDFHHIAVDRNYRGTGCKKFFPDAYSFDRAIIDTLSGLVFLHESVNIAHNDIKPANLLMVVNQDKTQIAKIGDLGLCTEFDKGKQIGSLGYSARKLHV